MSRSVEDRAGQSSFEFSFRDHAEVRAMQEREQQFESGPHFGLLERNRGHFEGDSLLPSLTFADQLLNLEILLTEVGGASAEHPASG